jgi:hypothetical protein
MSRDSNGGHCLSKEGGAEPFDYDTLGCGCTTLGVVED